MFILLVSSHVEPAVRNFVTLAPFAGGGGPAAALTAEEQLARYNEERCKGQSRGEHDSNIGRCRCVCSLCLAPQPLRQRRVVTHCVTCLHLLLHGSIFCASMPQQLSRTLTESDHVRTPGSIPCGEPPANPICQCPYGQMPDPYHHRGQRRHEQRANGTCFSLCRHLVPLLPAEAGLHAAGLPPLQPQRRRPAVCGQVVLHPVPGPARAAVRRLPPRPVSRQRVHEDLWLHTSCVRESLGLTGAHLHK